jgi:hypothetical protein
MSEVGSSGSWNGRRCTLGEKELVVRVVCALREGSARRRARPCGALKQLGFGVGSVRMWGKQADVDAGSFPGSGRRTGRGSSRSSRKCASFGV